MSLYLNELRKKPKHIRDNIAFGVAGGFTLLVAGITVLTGSFANSNLAIEENDERSPIFSTFFGQIKEQTAGAFSAMKPSPEPTADEVTPGPNLIDISNFKSEVAPISEKEVPIIIIPTASTTENASASTSPDVLY